MRPWIKKTIYIFFISQLFIYTFVRRPLSANSPSSLLIIKNYNQIYSLLGKWKIQYQDNKEYAKPDLNDGDWPWITISGSGNMIMPEKGSVIWCRLNFVLTPELPYTDLAVMTPFIKSAHEIYLNGTLIGSLGRISQDGKTLEQKARANYYLIPDSLLKKNNVLAIRISDRLGQINILHPFFYIGAKEKIIESFDSLLVRFSGIAAIFFIGFLFHLNLYFRRREDKYYLYFGLLSLLFALNILGRKAISYWLVDSYGFNEACINLYLTLVLFFIINFFHDFYNFRLNRFAQTGIILSILYAVFWLITILSDNFEYFYYKYILNAILITVIPYLLYYAMVTFRAMQKNISGAKIIGVGFLISMALTINDVLTFFNIAKFGYYDDIGNLILLFCMAMAMSERFSKSYDIIDTLNKEMAFQMGMAKSFQQKLLPKYQGGKNIYFFNKQAQEIGGDFFDFVPFYDPNKFGIFISDVSGHGIHAALITSMIKTIVLDPSSQQDNPALFMSRMNELLYGQLSDNYIPAFYGIFDKANNSISYYNAGHPPPYIIGKQNIELFENSLNQPIAITRNQDLVSQKIPYQNLEKKLEPGSKILFYTDGLLDCLRKSKHSESPKEILKSILKNYASLNPQEVIENLYNEISLQRGDDKFPDDLSLICVKVDKD